MDTTERRTPKRWTGQEDKKLRDEVNKQSTEYVKDWNMVASKLPGRTNKDCRKRWINHVCGMLKKGSWDKDEDGRLLAAVKKHGQKWTLVSKDVGLRSADQCAKRWQYNLNPELERGGWTKYKDDLLMDLIKLHGREWKLVQKTYFPTRSTNDLKNRYTILSRKRRSSRRRDCSSITAERQATATSYPSGFGDNGKEDDRVATIQQQNYGGRQELHFPVWNDKHVYGVNETIDWTTGGGGGLLSASTSFTPEHFTGTELNHFEYEEPMTPNTVPDAATEEYAMYDWMRVSQQGFHCNISSQAPHLPSPPESCYMTWGELRSEENPTPTGTGSGTTTPLSSSLQAGFRYDSVNINVGGY